MHSALAVALSTASALGCALLPAVAHAQFFGPNRGVTSSGDGHFRHPGTSVALLQTSTNPRVAWLSGDTAFSTVAFEFSMADLQGVAPYDICGLPNAPKLVIPIDPITPTAPIVLTLSAYEGSANGVVDGNDIATWNAGAFIADFEEVLVLEPNQTYTTLEFEVGWPYEALQRQNLSRQFVGFFLDRPQPGDPASQAVVVQNGGATVVYDSYFIDCFVLAEATSRGGCYDEFGDGRWSYIEFIDSAFDRTSWSFKVGGATLETDPDTGRVTGCNVTEYPGGFVENVTNFAPSTLTGTTNLAAYEVSLTPSIPVSATNRIRVQFGYQPFDTERTAEQRIQIYHAPNGVNPAVSVTDEFLSNRGGNGDGGWVTSTPRSSTSPFILAFQGDPVDRCSDVVASAFDNPMGTSRKLGSTLPLKLQLSLDGDTITTLSQLADLGLGAPRVHLYDTTDLNLYQPLPASDLDAGRSADELGNALRPAGGGSWVFNLGLTPTIFGANRTYEVRISLGTCELLPPNARFQTR